METILNAQLALSLNLKTVFLLNAKYKYFRYNCISPSLLQTPPQAAKKKIMSSQKKKKKKKTDIHVYCKNGCYAFMLTTKKKKKEETLQNV